MQISVHQTLAQSCCEPVIVKRACARLTFRVLVLVHTYFGARFTYSASSLSIFCLRASVRNVPSAGLPVAPRSTCTQTTGVQVQMRKSHLSGKSNGAVPSPGNTAIL